MNGQLSDLPRKSVEPIALAADVPVRTLQEFLSQHRWQEDLARDRLQEIVATEHAHPHSVGIIDETSFVKQGKKTPGVQRQYLGTVGKQENGIVTVHLAYAADDFHCLLDGELFLPESWACDPARCREAKIPEGMTYRPKTEIALELYDRARANGIHFAWLTFDEWYGGKPAFLQALDQRRQPFVAEVPRTLMGWIDPPRVTQRPLRRGRGRGRKMPRIVAGSRPAQSVEHLFWWHPALKEQDWQRWRVKDGEKGPMIWEVKHVPFYLQGPDGLPGAALAFGGRAQRARSHGDEVLREQCVAGDVGGHDPLGGLLALARGAVLRGRQRRGRPGPLRGATLSGTQTPFDPQRDQLLVPGHGPTSGCGGKKSELTVCQVHTAVSALIRSWWMDGRVSARLLERTAALIQRAQRRNACARRCHIKRTRRVLRSMGIKLTRTPRL